MKGYIKTIKQTLGDLLTNMNTYRNKEIYFLTDTPIERSVGIFIPTINPRRFLRQLDSFGVMVVHEDRPRMITINLREKPQYTPLWLSIRIPEEQDIEK